MGVLIEFMKSGSLSDISIGQKGKVIESKIGKPVDVVSLGDDLDLCSYGYGLELYFASEVLNKISIKYDFVSNRFILPDYLEVNEDNKLNGLNSLDDLVRHMDLSEIEWSINKIFSDDTTLCLTCNEATNVFYSLDNHHIISIQTMPSEEW